MTNIEAGRWGAELFRTVAFLVCANLPFWLLSTQYFILRPVVNSDVLVAMGLWAFSVPLGVLALGGVWAIDGMQSLSLVYHFPSVTEFARGARFAGELTWIEFLSPTVLVVFATAAISIGAMWLFFRHWRPRWFPMVIIGAALITADLANGSGLAHWLGRDTFLLPANINGSPSMNLAVAALQAEQQAKRPLQSLGMDGAPDIEHWALHTGGNVLIVIVESFGQHQSNAIQEWLSARLVDDEIRSRWEIKLDQAQFKGSTTAGELRILCRLGGHYTRLTTSVASNCIPYRLAQDGYETHGLHGFSSSMFDRRNWWLTIGLQHLTFGESMPTDVAKCGGAFRGVCDTAMIDRVAPLLDRSRQFVYLLTLNTHLPLGPIVLPVDLVDLCTAESVSEAVCQLTGQLGILLSRLNHLLRNVSKPPMVMVVGDHSPPFLVRAQREQFAGSTVPRYVMVPR